MFKFMIGNRQKIYGDDHKMEDHFEKTMVWIHVGQRFYV